jgi:uncharacterized protein (DUF58 family)
MALFRNTLLQAVSQVELRSRKHIASLLAGDYRSPFRGSGMQFKEFRQYEPGDDIRHMSWTTTARTGKPTVKVYEEERELNVLAIVDTSGSTLLGSAGRRKRDMFAEIMALLGLASIRSGDPFSLLLFADTVHTYLPPRRNQEHVRNAMLRILQASQASRTTDLTPALRYASKALKVRSLVFIVSDFLVPEFEKELRMVASRHEVVLLHGFDPSESGVGLDGFYPAQDPETGQYFSVDGNSKRTKQFLEANYLERRERLQSIARDTGSECLSLSAADDYLKQLVTFFRRRGIRR